MQILAEDNRLLKRSLASVVKFLDAKFPDWQLAEPLTSGPHESVSWILLPSRNASISQDGLSLTKTGGGRTGWDCNVQGSVAWTTGVHEFSVRLDTACEMMVGVAPAGATNRTGPNWSSCGFYMGTYSGALFGQDGTWKREYYGGKCSRKGTVISVRLDLNARSLTYAINGEWLDAAWNNLPAVPLSPSIDVDTKGCQFTIVDRKFKDGI